MQMETMGKLTAQQEFERQKLIDELQQQIRLKEMEHLSNLRKQEEAFEIKRK